MELKQAIGRSLKRWFEEKKKIRAEQASFYAPCAETGCARWVDINNPYKDDRNMMCTECELFHLMEKFTLIGEENVT